jgi:hypothetical protein
VECARVLSLPKRGKPNTPVRKVSGAAARIVQVEILFCGRGKAINAACCAALNSYRSGNRPDAILAQLDFLGRELESPAFERRVRALAIRQADYIAD